MRSFETGATLCIETHLNYICIERLAGSKVEDVDELSRQVIKTQRKDPQPQIVDESAQTHFSIPFYDHKCVYLCVCVRVRLFEMPLEPVWPVGDGLRQISFLAHRPSSSCPSLTV